VIDDIRVVAPEIFVEINRENQNNLREIQKNLSSGSPGSPQPGKEEKKGEAPRLILRRMTNMALAEMTRRGADEASGRIQEEVKKRGLEKLKELF